MILQNPMAPGLGVGGLSQAVQGFSCEEMGICVGFCCSESVSPMSNCPDVFQLRALLEGDADDNVATHVDGCRTCLERLDEVHMTCPIFFAAHQRATDPECPHGAPKDPAALAV